MREAQVTWCFDTFSGPNFTVGHCDAQSSEAVGPQKVLGDAFCSLRLMYGTQEVLSTDILLI